MVYAISDTGYRNKTRTKQGTFRFFYTQGSQSIYKNGEQNLSQYPTVAAAHSKQYRGADKSSARPGRKQSAPVQRI